MTTTNCTACDRMPTDLFCISHTCPDCMQHSSDVESHTC